MDSKVGNLAIGLVGLAVAVKVIKGVGKVTGSLVEKVKRPERKCREDSFW